MKNNEYWKANIRLISVLLSIWFVGSCGFGILLVDLLNMIKIGGYKLGFWFAQQGSILIFLILVLVYVKEFSRLERKYNRNEN